MEVLEAGKVMMKLRNKVCPGFIRDGEEYTMESLILAQDER
jgi:hypothetical protein